MYQDILVPTDGSPEAEAAVGRALDLARTSGGTIHALYVANLPGDPADLPSDGVTDARETAVSQGEDATTRIVDRTMEFDLDAVREVREGTPYRAILDYAREAGIDLVVMGTHGRTGAERRQLGSTTERVIAHSLLPVMAVRLTDTPEEPDAARDTYEHVVVPTDGSDVADRAAEQALGIAEVYGAAVHVLYVVDPTSTDLQQIPRSIVGLLKEGGSKAVEAVAVNARERELSVSTRILRGVPEEAILKYANNVDADLVAMGTRGRAAPDDRFLGSTTVRVVRRSEIPVLTVN